MKIVFLGTPEIAKVCLDEILRSHHKVVAVVTKPDKPAGRGKKIQMSPVKMLALEKKLPVFQFENINEDGVNILKKLKPDVLVLVAFGQILKQEILDIALPINLHPSLLPKYRGPSPVQSAILNGETETGISIIKMANDVDAGDVLLQNKIAISPDDNSQTLFEKLAKLGGKVLVECLDLIEQNKSVFTPQSHSEATFTSIITKQSSKLDFNNNTADLINKIRAYSPSPAAFFELDGTKYKVFKAQEINGNESKNISQQLTTEKEINLMNTEKKAGEIVVASNSQGLIIKTADGYIEILELQFPNSARMSAKNFLNGRNIKISSMIE
ncbi:MAG: methionyl-tRNA formyltransferase [Clostridia bacterium]|nr:methionyl-tRNA formyltransferase [Clostridia bacterium]